MQEEITRQLKQSDFLATLTEDQIRLIYKKSKRIGFSKGDLIFCQGDASNAFYIVLHGWVTVIREGKNAEQTVLHVLKDGDSFAEPAALILDTYPANAYAATDSELLEIRTDVFKQMVQQDPDIAMHLIARLSQRLRNMVNEFEQYKTMSVPRRLALFLLDQTDTDSGQVAVDLPFSKMILAAYLGIQPESLSRAFSQLKKQGVKSDGRTRIVIEDVKRLTLYAESG